MTHSVCVCVVSRTIKVLHYTKGNHAHEQPWPLIIHQTHPERNFSHCKSRLCQHTMMGNNKDVILCTVPWQLLSCHYTIMKSFPCLTWKHIIMIKNNSEMSINATPLLPRNLWQEIPHMLRFNFSVHFLPWSYNHHSGWYAKTRGKDLLKFTDNDVKKKEKKMH